MKCAYTPQGVCSRRITFELDGGIIRQVLFEGGCDGNGQAVARLAEGRNIEELIDLLSGIRCGSKKTSCPDQFAAALRAVRADGRGGLLLDAEHQHDVDRE